MTTGIQGDGDFSMAQPLADNLRIYSSLQHKCGMSMPEVMEVDVGQSSLPNNFGKGISHSAGVQRLAVKVSENKVAVSQGFPN